MNAFPKTAPAPDWEQIIAQLCARGLTYGDISRETRSYLTNRMVSYYAQGVQPLHWRGEAMIALWIRSTGSTRDQLPMTTISVAKGRAMRARSAERPREPEPVIEVPVFPVPQPKRRGRPPKVR